MTKVGLDKIFDGQASFVRRRTLSSGQLLFSMGSPVEFVFRVVTGSVRVEILPEDGRQLVVCRASSGELIGADHLTRQFYGVTATADERTVIDAVGCETVLKCITNDETLLRKYLDCLTRQQGMLCESLERISIQSAKQRVLHLLESLIQRKGSNSLDLKGRVKSLSFDLNLSHEATYRALRKLEAEGFIQRDDGHIRLIRSPSSCQKHSAHYFGETDPLAKR